MLHRISNQSDVVVTPVVDSIQTETFRYVTMGPEMVGGFRLSALLYTWIPLQPEVKIKALRYPTMGVRWGSIVTSQI